MALSLADFSMAQANADPSIITFTDISTGTDVGLTTRRILIALVNGKYLTATGETSTLTYIDWPIANATLSISVLLRSESPTVTVDWMTGATVSYTKTRKGCFDLHDYIFMLTLGADQVANNSITQDTDWYNNKMKVIVNIKDAETAIIYNNNSTLSQNSLDRNYFIISNKNKFF